MSPTHEWLLESVDDELMEATANYVFTRDYVIDLHTFKKIKRTIFTSVSFGTETKYLNKLLGPLLQAPLSYNN